MMLLAWTPGISMTEDLGRHLLLGQIISEQHAVPDTNLLTYTHPEFPFVNHHWLSEVLFYQLHRLFGLNGLIVLKMLMMGLALGLALCAIVPKRNTTIYWSAGLLAAVTMGFRAHIQPELFTYVFVGLYLWLFEHMRRGAKWPRWVILPMALIWANCHIYFIFGLVMIAAYAWERWRSERGVGSFFTELGWGMAALLLSCFNPNGLGGLTYPFRIFSNYGIGITRNASPLECWQTVVNPMLIALPWMAVLLVFALLINWRTHVASKRIHPLRWANVLIAFVALVAACRMARNAPLLALTALPVIAAAMSPDPESDIVRSYFFAAKVLLAILACVANVFLIQGLVTGWYTRIFPSPIAPTAVGFDRPARYVAVRKLVREAGLRGPVFTDYNLGSLVEYNIYPELGYVDNRPEAFPASFWRTEYLPALSLGSEWERIRDERDINAIIVSLPGVKEAYCQNIMSRPLWVLVHLDEFCAVWVKNTIENRQVIDSHFFSLARINAYERDIAERIVALQNLPWWRRQIEAEALIYRLYSLICIGEGHRTWPHLLKLNDLYPDYQIVHELMRVTVPIEEIETVETILKKRAQWPLAAKQVLDWGDYLLNKGLYDQALRVFRRGRFFFPLSPALRDAIADVEDVKYQQGR